MANAGYSYEAWKEAQMKAEPEGEEAWSEEISRATSSGLMSSLVDMKGMYTGLFLGIGLFIGGFAILLPNCNHLSRGKRTIGMVVSYKDFINRRSNNLVVPIIRYSAPGGVYDFVGVLSVPRSLYPIDKEVTVLYLPNNPRNAVVVDFVQMFMIPSILCSLGLIVLSGTAVMMFFVARSELADNTAPKISTAQIKPPPAAAAPQTAGSTAS